MKSYNPIWMIGSWIGMLMGSFIFGYIQPINGIIETPIYSFASFLVFIIVAGFSFLIGWGIHSIIRYLGEVRWERKNHQ